MKRKKDKTAKERMRRYRERLSGKEVVTHIVTRVVTDEDIKNLPLSLRFQLDRETLRRKVLKQPDNLRERQENMVKRFRGF